MGKREEAARAVQSVFSDFGLDSPELDRIEAHQLVNAVIACIREPNEKALKAGWDVEPKPSMRCPFPDFVRQFKAVFDAME